MCDLKISLKPPKRKTRSIWRVLVVSIIVFALFASFGPIGAAAVWDGTGSAGGTGGTEEVSNYYLAHANIEDAMGYRFSIYNGDGSKVGHCVDINFETNSSSLYRSYKENKKSHVELYATYTSTGDAATGKLSTDDTESGYVLYDTSLPALADPPTIGQWLTYTRASYIASLCGAYSFGSFSDHYMIIEPIYVAYLNDGWYAMTMAEYAVYQAHQIGWDSATGSNYGYGSGSYMWNVGRFTSAVWGRYLYATGTYPVLGTSPVVEADHLTVDYNQTNSIALPDSYNGRNTAASVLKYQVGMAIYTDIVSKETFELHYDGNGAGSGTMEPQSAALGSSVVVLPNGFNREGYTFAGWNTKPDGSGTVYLAGDSISLNNDLTLYAQWAPSDEPEPGSANSGYLRFILPAYLDTLDYNSKWRQEPLKSYLEDILSEDLSDPENCEQVWHFSAEEYEEVHEWCLERDKGTQTNKDFLEEFGDNRIK